MNIRAVLIVPLIFSGCMTTSVIRKAKADRQNQEVLLISGAYSDTAGNITINFRAKLSKAKKNEPVHVTLPVDSLVELYLRHPGLDTLFAESPGGVNGIFPVLDKTADSLGFTPNIELTQRKVKEGFYEPSPTDTSIGGRFRLPLDVRAYHRPTFSGPVSRMRLLMLYKPPTPYAGRYQPVRDVMISVEPSYKRKRSRYLLTALSVPADIITSPFQAIGLGVMFLIATAIKS